MDIDIQPLDMVRVIESAYRELKLEAHEKDLEIKIQSDENLDAEVYMDRKIITKVILNLIANAIKFSDTDSDIHIRIKEGILTINEEETPAIQVSVIDKGQTIEDNELEEIFDKFVQSNKTKTGAGGTGLGLAICKEIIAVHNGKIWADHNPDGGVIITFMVPKNGPHDEANDHHLM